jgi:NDP-sugar pyrophosphorylase family protein
MPIREAVILAAGLGLRMRPVSESVAKPAIPYLNRPILHWTLDGLRAAGVERVIINLHHLPQSVKAAAESAASGLDLRYSFEPEILGTAGVFGPLRGLIQGDAFLVVNGDVVHEIPYGRLATELEAPSEALAVLALRPALSPYTPVAMDLEGRITSFGSGAWMFSGIYAARRKLLEHLPGPGPRELVPDLLRPLLPSGTVRGAECLEPWLDLGSPETFLRASLSALPAMAQGIRVAPTGSVVETRDGHTLLRHGTAWVSRDATLTGDSVAGENVKVEARAHVGRAVLLPGVRVGQGQWIEDGIALAADDETRLLKVSLA